eukprot:Lithocolla_globosa_v1_NODE_9569_length_689_cov_16.333333.p1 type:complete len:153 gc:universal NODE_9569_length_689_cov_16.333333:489-31(-)
MEKQTLDQILKPIYYNPASGFQWVDKLYLRVKDTEAFKEGKFKRQNVKDWLQQTVQQTHSQPKKTKEVFSPIMTEFIDEEWHLDLIDMQKFAKDNSGHAWILFGVDILSRFAFVEPIKSKGALAVSEAFKKIMKKSNREPAKITTDSGGEFN